MSASLRFRFLFRLPCPLSLLSLIELQSEQLQLEDLEEEEDDEEPLELSEVIPIDLLISTCFVSSARSGR